MGLGQISGVRMEGTCQQRRAILQGVPTYPTTGQIPFFLFICGQPVRLFTRTHSSYSHIATADSDNASRRTFPITGTLPCDLHWSYCRRIHWILARIHCVHDMEQVAGCRPDVGTGLMAPPSLPATTSPTPAPSGVHTIRPPMVTYSSPVLDVVCCCA